MLCVINCVCMLVGQVESEYVFSPPPPPNPPTPINPLLLLPPCFVDSENVKLKSHIAKVNMQTIRRRKKVKGEKKRGEKKGRKWPSYCVGKWLRTNCPLPCNFSCGRQNRRGLKLKCCFTSTETVALLGTESPGRPPRLSHSS